MDKRNYYITFRSFSLRKNPDKVNMIPKQLGFLPIASSHQKTIGELLAARLYFKKNKSYSWVMKKMDRYYSRYYCSNFGHCEFQYVIHYSGYEKDIINMFYQADSKRVIFVHNDMIGEMKSKGNQHRLTLERAYHGYDKVVPVTKDILESTLQIGHNEKNIHIVNNCHDYALVKEKSLGKICFEDDTQSNVSLERLKKILDSSAKKIITIGRFSAEKGHFMLMDAFEKYYSENKESYLIIIGGYGQLYEKTVEYAERLEAYRNIFIIKSMVNPMPVLKKCDVFILSSLYEGLGLVLLEADTLGIPVISTDIVGPRGFLKEHGGYLVKPNNEGLYQGIKAFDEGKVCAMNVDYEQYNQNSVQQFESLFEGEA